MPLAFPYRVDAGGRTATTAHARYVASLVEIALLTAPGERVNRPELGTGLMHAVFAPLADEAVATVELLVRGALREQLASVLEVEDLTVRAEGAVLEVRVRYRLRADGATGEAVVRRAAP
jgi:phage baseplate assembly protein W